MLLVYAGVLVACSVGFVLLHRSGSIGSLESEQYAEGSGSERTMLESAETPILAYPSEFRKRFSMSWTRLPPTLAAISIGLLAPWMGSVDGGYFVGDWVPPTLILATLTLLVSVIDFSRGTKLRWSALALGLFATYTAWIFASLL
jgi:hypothetical protein